MTADDQHFLDVLAGYSKDIRKFTGELFDASDRHFESVASYIDEKIGAAEWLPRVGVRRPPPPRFTPKAPASQLGRIQNWISENRALTAAVFAFIGTGAFLIYREKKKHNRKRRARRASNGARREVVVVAGPPGSSITKSISLDLERRGFIVYILCASVEDEQQVQSEGRVDIRPLHIDIADSFGTQEALERFSNLLMKPHVAFSGASPHNLNFRGLLMVPDLIYPTGPIETVSPELWSDALNAKVLNTVATAQVFLPTICDFKARTLILTPNIVSSLRPPFHSVENTVVGALEGFAASISRELGTLGIDVCHLKLGTFDYTNVGGKTHLQTLGGCQTHAWPASTKSLYASNFVNQDRISRRRGILTEPGGTGSTLRELHNAVFDALTQKHPKKVWRVGRGSVTYDLVGNWVPAGLVGWMMGIRRVSLDESASPQLEDSVQSWEKVESTV